MADNRVIFEVVTTAKGTKVVQRQTEDLAKSVEKVDSKTKNLDKTQEKNYGRLKQGVIQTANGTKNFSKMAQTIGGGSSGLVGAYATLAANVFAASAAFNFLKNSARFDVLTEGITALGDQSGRTLSVMAGRLREVTGAAISVEESFRSAALGISGGFGEEELAGLAKVAKGASIALGRDLGDAFDRLTRGAIKLEPEILDELGIMVRLDDAVDNYATVLGKSASSLTQLERRQAFMNAILEQGEIKFGAIAEKVDTNPYDRLGASFSDLARQLGQILNVAIIPFVEVLAGNIGFLVAASLLLVSTFAKQMVPSLLQGGKAAAATSAKFAQLAKDKRAAAIETLKPMSDDLGPNIGSKDTRKEIALIKRSNGQIQVSDTLTKSLNRSKGQYTGTLKRLEEAKKQGLAYDKQELKLANQNVAAINLRIEKVKQLADQQLSAKGASAGATSADLRSAQQKSISGILDTQAGRTPLESLKNIPGDFRKIGEATKNAKVSYIGFLNEQKKGVAGTSAASRMFTNLKFTATAASGGLRVLGAAFLNMIPLIGQIIFAGTMVVQVFKWFTKNEPMEELKKSLEDLDTILEGVKGKTEEFNRVNAQVKDPFQKLVAGYTVASGLIDETVTALEKVLEKQKEIDNSRPSIAFEFAANDDIEGALVSKLEAANKKFGDTLGVEIPITFLQADRNKIEESGVFKVLAELREGPKIIQDILNSKLDLSEMITKGLSTQEILEKITTALKETKTALKDTGPALKDLQAEFKNSENTMSTFFNKAFPKTKFDDVAKQFISLTNSFNTAIGKIAGSLGENGEEFLKNMDLSSVGDDLKRQFAEATSGGGSNFNSLLTSDVAGSDVKLLATMEARIAKEEEIANIHKNMMGPMNDLSVQLAQEQLLLLEDQLKSLTKQETEQDGLVKLKAEQISLLSKEFNELQKGARINASMNKAATERLKLLKSATKFQGALAYTLGQQNAINERNIKHLEKEIDMQQAIATTKREAGEADLQLEAYILSLNTQKDTAERNIIKPLEMQLKLKEAQVSLAREELKIEKERAGAILSNLKNEAAIANYKRTGVTELDPVQKFKFEVEAAKQKRDLALSEINLRMTMLDVEASIVQARLKATAAEIRKDDPAGAAQLEQAGRDVVANTGKARAALQASISNISSSFEAEITNAMVSSLSGANTAQAVANVQTLIAERGANAYNKVIETAGAAAYAAAIKRGETEEQAQYNSKQAEAAAIPDADKAQGAAKQLSLGDAKSMLAPQLEMLSQLGPEGELVAAATSGVLNIASAFQVLGQAGGDAGAKAAAGMSILNAVNSMMQASAKAKTAALDQDINAEKKRDGKSKESLAKIAAMEKKKEGIARKAFEMNKKIQIANALINTYSAVTGALGAHPWTYANIAIAAAMGVLGMAQVASIAKQQFQGGAASDAPTVQNTALEIGGRSSSVDTSQKITGGELSYLRGARGSGTSANNFTPGGAMGRKGYADGGMLVGERGPEVVTKEEIIPNYALGKNGTTNVNFSISAVDGASVQKMLNDQQGNIIQMIRDAANDNGEAFLESVDPSVYNGGSVG